jgi:hypothetical protein
VMFATISILYWCANIPESKMEEGINGN